MAIEVMGEKGIDISQQEPKNVGDYLGRLAVRHLIIVCSGVNEKCPRIFPGMMNRMFWPFDDPAGHSIEEFRRVRDEIEAQIKQWLAEKP
jgi:arsenate reductase (thioredoxin)